jgi:hypothetical protein
MSQKPASQQTYNNLKNGPAKPTTPDETQSLENTPRLSTIYKGSLTRSHLYERLYPDGQTATLRIDGPGDSFIAMGNLGTLTLVTGKYSKEIGAGSGRLNIHTYGGQQQKHDERSNFEYNAGSDPEKQAINIMAYGDVVEEARGGERHVRAKKIVISASEELVLAGQTITIQANSGSGSIQMFAGNVEQTTANKKDVVSGQVMKFGVSEESTIQFDPRASVSWISPGHVNWKVLGDYQQWVGGAFQQVIAGGLPVPPLIKDRSETYQVNTLLGGIGFTADTEDITFAATTGGFYGYSVSGIDLASSTGDILISSGSNVNITATANVAIQGALILLN